MSTACFAVVQTVAVKHQLMSCAAAARVVFPVRFGDVVCLKPWFILVDL